MLVPQQLEALVSVEPEADDFILDREEELASTLLNKVRRFLSRHDSDWIDSFCNRS